MFAFKLKSLYFLPFSILIAILGCWLQVNYGDEYKELGMSIQELIAHRGFQSETHFITSQGGYLLQVVRIVNPFVSDRRKLKPVLLHHGFQFSGAMWVMVASGRLRPDGTYWEDAVHSVDETAGNATGNTLGFVLATSGYDVWLASSRGSIYSANHTTLNPEETPFWEFSADELIQYDLPAMIDYIRAETHRPSIAFIGHSQGNLLMFGLLSSQPRFNQIIKPYIGLSPISSFIQFNVPFIVHIEPYRDLLPRFFPHDFMGGTLRNWGIPKLCALPLVSRFICYPIIYALIGSPVEQIDLKRLPIYLDNALHGTSTRNFVHLLQHRLSLVHYNYGDPEVNFRHYNQTYPPLYDYGKITNPHMISIVAPNDWFFHEEDRQRFKDSLKSVELAEEYAVPDTTWNHMELVWAKNVGKLVNRKILQVLEKY